MDRKIIEKYVEGKEITSIKTVKGVGTIRSYGELVIEKLVKRLLETDYLSK
ncbi:hypothetical protein [Cytobacillus oceanisediminis]|uniref:hypothetical protein n=1 Tax=Cytobacillus oceanisediminis TaxID=665099 RepID=UPI002495762D|nr:hypothetical protein [Cytobacillus oceanisediminis]